LISIFGVTIVKRPFNLITLLNRESINPKDTTFQQVFDFNLDDSVTTKIMNDPIDEDKEIVDVNESENEDIQECKVQVEGKVKSGCKHAFKWIHEEGQEQVLYYTVDGKECEVVIPYLLEQQL
jgi:hypothetical protein